MDPFVPLHIAYLDRRLRGVISARVNSAHCNYTWPLANSMLYLFALSQKRSFRQSHNVLMNLIEMLCPTATQTPFLAGSAGNHNPTISRKIRLALAQSIFVQRLSGSMKKTRFSWMDDAVLSSQGRCFLDKVVSPNGITLLKTGSRSFDSVKERLLTAFFFSQFVEAMQMGLHHLDKTEDVVSAAAFTSEVKLRIKETCTHPIAKSA